MRLFPRVGVGALSTAAGRTTLLLTPFDGLWGRDTGPSIRRAVIQALRQDASVSAIVGGRIFDRYIPQDVPDRPALIVSLVSQVDRDTLPGDHGHSVARFQFQTNTPVDASTDAGEAGERAAQALRLLFHRLKGVELSVPGSDPVLVLWARRDGMADVVLPTSKGGETPVITRSDFLFCYRHIPNR